MGQVESKSTKRNEIHFYFYDLMPFGLSEYRKSFEKTEEESPSAVLHGTHHFLSEMSSILTKHVHSNNDRSEKVLEFHHPRLLMEKLNKVLFLEEKPQDLNIILKQCAQVLKYCVRTGHPRFFNQISQGLDIVGLVGEWATAASNMSLSDEDASIFRRMEAVVLGKMRKYLGWEEGDDILTPGGTMSNLYSIAVARHKMFPHCNYEGVSGSPPLVLFTSDQSHFSIKRAGVLLGVGSDHVILVNSDERGKMSVTDLRIKIEESLSLDLKPFLVAATSGTTVLGAFDSLQEIADVCEEYGLWLHVDAAWGGGLLLSRTHRHLMQGIHRANSVTWNPHKLMGVPLQCSAFFVKEKGLLAKCFHVHESIGVFAGDEFVDRRAMQGTRHNDALKLWLLWKCKGCRMFENQIDELMKLSRYMQTEISARPGFEFVLEEPEYLNICFWYVPQKLRHLPCGKERDDKLSVVASKVKAVMMEKGQTMVGYQPLGMKPNFFRMIISNPATSEKEVDYLLDQIQLYGEL